MVYGVIRRPYMLPTPFVFFNSAVIQNITFEIFKYTYVPHFKGPYFYSNSRDFTYRLIKEIPTPVFQTTTPYSTPNYLAYIFSENVDVLKSKINHSYIITTNYSF